MAWFRNTPQPIKHPVRSVSARPKKGKCKIKFKKTADGEAIEFSPECSESQIQMAKQMREEKRSSDYG